MLTLLKISGKFFLRSFYDFVHASNVMTAVISLFIRQQMRLSIKNDQDKAAVEIKQKTVSHLSILILHLDNVIQGSCKLQGPPH